ncbi:MAG: type II secretion system GspH family protein [Puniceicoccales bacterium]|jgi:prepilin-type N-terminal cleavage/methylation domain-containing protein|nr:type II secretion system GspH family protein [Puniceicoccales bacterium]
MKRKTSGFTLIEVLAVISIIGILATILTPSIGNMIDRARRARVSNNMRQIAIAHQSYLNDGRSSRNLRAAATLAQWALLLAQATGVNNGALYVVAEDYLVTAESRNIPKVVGRHNGDSWEPAEDFASFPLGVTVITGISPTATPSNTPLAYTRGLNPETGRWKAATGTDGGIYGEKGGLIVFLDGHVEFFESINGDNSPFVDYQSGLPTTDIRQAVNSGARAINWQGVVWEN